MSTRILKKMREMMLDVGYNKQSLSALIVTNYDTHMSEYINERDKRLHCVSNFSGSAGTAVITEDEARLWTDGRYFIQASQEIDSNWHLMKVGVLGVPTEGAWMAKNLPEGSLVGTDPKLIPYNTYLSYKKDLEQAGIKLVPLPFNFIDRIWEKKPELVPNKIEVLSTKFAGNSPASKIRTVRLVMKEKNVGALLISALDEVAWLLNLRGNDIPYNPVFYCYVVVLEESIDIFVDQSKLDQSTKNHLEEIKANLHPYGDLYSYLSNMRKKLTKIWLCRSANYEIYQTFPDSQKVCECSPIAVMKAVKNETETKGMINAHIKDGIALCRFIHWLEETISNEKITEISAAEVLEGFRRDESDYVGPSFPTISSTGPHAAITHYSPVPNSDRELSWNEIYLCDSGAQYLDGTTDVTRTICFATPTNFQREAFTRVVKGVISLATAIFPYGIKGNCLDTLARKALWDVGLDYKHGTGHGIGAYLCVHEGPMGISWRPFPDDPGLQENMFLSDEPGYYKDGEFGIRIENIVRIVPASVKFSNPSEPKAFLTFDTVTLCPIQKKFLDSSLLNENEIGFINNYHAQVINTLGPILIRRGLNKVYEWLKVETAPI